MHLPNSTQTSRGFGYACYVEGPRICFVIRPWDGHSHWQRLLTTLLRRPAEQEAATTQVLQQQEALLTGLLLLAQSICQSTAGAQLLLRWGLMSQLSELARWLLERVLDAGVKIRQIHRFHTALLCKTAVLPCWISPSSRKMLAVCCAFRYPDHLAHVGTSPLE